MVKVEMCIHIYTYAFLPWHFNQVQTMQENVLCCFCVHSTVKTRVFTCEVHSGLPDNFFQICFQSYTVTNCTCQFELLTISGNLMLITKTHKPLNKQTYQRSHGLACYAVLDDLFFSMLMGIGFYCPPVI